MRVSEHVVNLTMNEIKGVGVTAADTKGTEHYRLSSGHSFQAAGHMLGVYILKARLLKDEALVFLQDVISYEAILPGTKHQTSDTTNNIQHSSPSSTAPRYNGTANI